MDEERRHDLIALALLTAVVCVLFADVLSGHSALYWRDVSRYYYPAKHVLREIVAGGEFPYWNRFFSAGQPLAANPEHEVFYPLTWLILLPSFDYGFQLFIVLHLVLAAWSMFALLRSLELRPAAAVLGALSFALGGLMLGYTTLLPYLASMAWMPLVFLFARRFLHTGAGRDFAWAAFFWGLMVLIGEPTTLLQSGLLLGMYAMSKRGLRGLLPIALLSIAAVLVGAVQMLPAMDHASESVRASGFSFETVTNWSMPPARVFELFFPHLFGHNILDGRSLIWVRALYGTRHGPFLLSIYPGFLIIALCMAGLVARAKGTRLVLIVLAASLLLAAGAHTPLWRMLYDAGIARSIRYPEKFLLMGVFAITVFGAKSLDALLAGDARLRRIALGVVFAITLLAGVAAAIASTRWYPDLFASLWTPSGNRIQTMLQVSRNDWWLAVARGVLLLALLRFLPRAKRPVWLAMAGLFVVLDSSLLLRELTPRTEPDFLRSQPPMLQELPSNRTEFRLFHLAAQHTERPQVAAYFQNRKDERWLFRNGSFPMLPATHGVQTVIGDDFDATSLEATEAFSKSVWDLSDRRPDWASIAAAMSNAWYATVFVDPRQAFARANGEMRLVRPVRLLPFEHVPRYVFARSVESIHDRRDFVEHLASSRYRPGTAFVYGPAFTPAPGRVLAAHETANTARIDVETAGTAFLMMSVTPHKYWQVFLDGRETPSVVTNVGYQGVILPAAGKHRVEMRYHNPLIAAGGAISLATLAALLLIARRR